MTKLKRVAIYTRVSTDGQSVANQRRELLAVAERRGWEVVQEYTDHGISGAKDRDKRPAFDRMLKGATRREFDMIAAWSVDRLGRSLQHLVAFLGEVHGAGVGLYLHQQALDTSTPAGEAMFQMCGVFAQFVHVRAKGRDVDAQRAACGAWAQHRTADRHANVAAKSPPPR